MRCSNANEEKTWFQYLIFDLVSRKQQKHVVIKHEKDRSPIVFIFYTESVPIQKDVIIPFDVRGSVKDSAASRLEAKALTCSWRHGRVELSSRQLVPEHSVFGDYIRYRMRMQYLGPLTRQLVLASANSCFGLMFFFDHRLAVYIL